MITRDNVCLCMIVKNESRSITEAIQSASSSAARIIVVDTGSTDNTPELAHKEGAEVYANRTSDLSVARNFALSKVPYGDWVLWLDADEVWEGAPRDLYTELNTEGIDAFQVPLFNYVGQGAWAVFSKPSLVRNRPGVLFRDAIHESIHPALRAVGAKVLPIESQRIQHAEGLHGDRSINKRMRNIDGLQPDLTGRESPAAHAMAALEWHALGDTERSIKHLEEALRINPDHSRSRLFKAQLLLQNGDVSESLATIDGISSDFKLGDAFEVLRMRAAETQDDLESALLHATRQNSSSAHRYLNVGMTLLSIGQTDAARRQLREAHQRNHWLLDPWVVGPNSQKASLFGPQVSTCRAWEFQQDKAGLFHRLELI